jgi:glutaredoxin
VTSPRKTEAIALLFLFLCAAMSRAEVYKWTDAKGNIQFSDAKPATVKKVETVKVQVSTYSFVKTTPLKTPLPVAARGAVTLYGTRWCGYCKQARAYFRSNHIPYRDLDIENDSQAKAEYEQLGASGVPVILAGRQRMDGFSPEGFRAIYPQ